MWQSGTKKNATPALNTIRNPAFDIAEDKVLRQFAKARTLTNLMLEVTKSTELGACAFANLQQGALLQQLERARHACPEGVPRQGAGKVDGEKARSTGRDTFYNSGRLGT